MPTKRLTWQQGEQLIRELDELHTNPPIVKDNGKVVELRIDDPKVHICVKQISEGSGVEHFAQITACSVHIKSVNHTMIDRGAIATGIFNMYNRKYNII